MKRVIVLLISFVATFAIAFTLILYFQSDSRPIIVCASLDDSIRPRDYCLMNPFRDKRPEILAEEVLEQLKNGNPKSILPYIGESSEIEFSEYVKNNFVEKEKKYKVENWRIGDREDSIGGSAITYWVSRNNYFNGHEESVCVWVAKEGGNWKLKLLASGY
jgi:hypothetical protein